MTQYENIMRELGNIKSVLASPGGFTWDGKHYPSISAVQIENQRRINAIPDRIWRETVVHRGGEEVPVLQDLADGTTHAGRAAELVKTLQGLTDEDLAKIATLIDAVKGEVTVKVITDREGAPK